MTSRQTKEQAQSLLMDYIADCVGFWDERLEGRRQLPETEEERLALGAEIRRQAQRLYKTFGYTCADWNG